MLEGFSISQGIKNILKTKKEQPESSNRLKPPSEYQSNSQMENLYSEINSILNDNNSNFDSNPIQHKSNSKVSDNKFLEDNKAFFSNLEEETCQNHNIKF